MFSRPAALFYIRYIIGPCLSRFFTGTYGICDTDATPGSTVRSAVNLRRFERPGKRGFPLRSVVVAVNLTGFCAARVRGRWRGAAEDLRVADRAAKVCRPRHQHEHHRRPEQQRGGGPDADVARLRCHTSTPSVANARAIAA